MANLTKYLKPYTKEVVIGPIFKLIEAIFELIVPLVMAKIIDVGIKNSDMPYILKMGAVMIGLGILGWCSALVCQYSAAKASQGFGTQLRSALYRHINSFSHREIDTMGVPSLITRMTNDINALQLAVAMLIRLVVRCPFLVIGATIMSMMIDIKLSLIFLASIPLIGGTIYLIMHKSVPFFRNMQKSLDKVSKITRENLEGVRVVRAFNRQKTENQRFDEEMDTLTGISIASGKISSALNPMTYVIVNLAIVLIIWFGGHQVNSGDLTQGQIVALVNYMSQILMALMAFANVIVIFTKAQASQNRVSEVLDIQSTIFNKADNKADKSVNQNADKVAFCDAGLSYEKDGEYALESISFTVKSGQLVGIIGGTGCGKTSLINLIPRFYDVTVGQVLVDGIDVREENLKVLRQKIGIVPQEAVLFSGTLRENMNMGKENATDEEIARALRVAQAEEFVAKWPNRYDTKIEQGGRNLSGGQKQRLCLARALIKNPEILILDDSASALDYATDLALRRAIRKECHNMTVFLVSQRANTIRDSDKIIVLDDGHIDSMGTHEELIKTSELYAEICASQENNGDFDSAKEGGLA